MKGLSVTIGQNIGRVEKGRQEKGRQQAPPQQLVKGGGVDDGRLLLARLFFLPLVWSLRLPLLLLLLLPDQKVRSFEE